MKKILFIFYFIICSFIFYSIILGKNGLLEGYKIKRESEIVKNYLNLLKEEKEKLEDYLIRIKTDPYIYESLANDMGFFKEDSIKLIKFKGRKKLGTNLIESDIYYDRYIENNISEIKILQLKKYIVILFYLFFASFIILIIFSGKERT